MSNQLTPAAAATHDSSRRPLIVAFIVFLIAAAAAGLLVRQSEQQRLQEQRTRLADQASNRAHAIQRNIEHALSATYALAALVRQGKGSIPDFDAIAREMLPYYPGAAALQLAPGGIVQHIVPLAGNEKAIGHNLLQDPARDQEAFRARDTGKLTLAGPFNLMQGGLGAVGRLPVFLDDGKGKPSFWGFTTVLIRFPEAIEDAGLPQLAEQGLGYELWRIHPDTGQKQTIAASSSAALIDPVAQTLEMPNGAWTLSLAPVKGWGAPLGLTLKGALGLLFSLLLGYLAKLLVELKAHKRHLEALVVQRTAEIAATQGKLQATFDAIPDLVWLKDVEGVFLDCNLMFERLLGAKKAGILGKTDYDFVDQELADSFREYDRRAIEAGKPSSNEEWLTFAEDGQRRLFETTKTPMRDAAGKLVGVLGVAHDITKLKQTEENLHLSASVFTHSRDGIMITTADGTIIDVNDAFCGITGYNRDEVLGRNPRLRSSGRQGKEFYTAMWRSLIEKGHWYGEIWNRRKNGEVYAEMQTISTVRDAQGNTGHYVALFSDITVLKDHQKQLERIGHYDALTSLPNRVLLADRLHQGMAQAQRHGQLLAVVFLDLDGFKAINDCHGHETGDQLLIALSTRMKQTLREGDTLARLGGDEFVAVLLDLANIEASMPMLNRLLDAAAQPVQVGERMLQVSASLGVTFYPQAQDEDADQLLRQADQAMYQAKLAGKNRYHLFDAAQDRSVRGHHESLERIRRALVEREFVLYYQPKVNMRTGAVIGAEALIRWQHPQRGLLPPTVFLQVIENHPLAVELGEWVIDSALTQMALWQAAGMDIPVSVNVGARQLQQADFVARLREILAAHPNARAGDLELEVLETSALEDLAHVSQVIEACRELGVNFSLDDFGTGYSSLTYLKRLPVTQLKIDQSFVRNMLDDPDDLAILEGVIGLAVAFHLQVVAEGVETVEHGEMLLQLGCELAQGHGIARPMPAHELPGWTAAWRPDPAWVDLPAVSRDDLPLLFAGIEHCAWIADVENHLRGEREAPPSLDHQQSRFGQWFNARGRARHGAQPAFQAIQALHREVHARAAELCELKVRGRGPEAQVRLGELHDLRNALLEQLKTLEQQTGRLN
nr:EAL domain-containing protein [Rhodoferax sp.]